MNRLDALLPRPRLVQPAEGSPNGIFPTGLTLAECPSSPRLERAAARLVGTSEGGGAPLRLVVDGGISDSSEAYRLEVESGGVRVVGASEAGVYRGLTTLAQLAGALREPVVAGAALELPFVRIEDAPDFPARGVSLDVNRDKVPTMDTLYALVDKLSGWKMNQLQLYMEHIFAYEGHEEVWRGHDPFTAEEIRALDEYCADRFVELVPNQNALAHFHRWLTHERYRDLAEIPEGIEHPFAFEPEPFSLCPTDPRSIELLDDLFGQLLPNFTSRMVNVGLDEPIDIGKGRSKEVADEKGIGGLFLDHLHRVRDIVHKSGHTMQFWADWILLYPDRVAELPRDVIANCWGYEAEHPFEKELDLLSRSVDRFYVCPGTSSWNSICGRSANMLANVASAGRVGTSKGAEGYLVTDWGDNGHWQPLPISYPGFAQGAATGWNEANAPDRDELATLLDLHVFGGEEPGGETSAGRAFLDLGDAHAAGDARCTNGSAPFFLVHFSHQELPHPRLEGLTAAGLEATLGALDSAVSKVGTATFSGPEAERHARELSWAADFARVACRVGLARLEAEGAALGDLPAEQRTLLASRLRDVAARHRDIWLERNREGGLADSVMRIERVARMLGS